MNYDLEQYLRHMGILPAKNHIIFSDGDPEELDFSAKSKHYFNDPRDPVTGEVPF